MWGVLTGAVCRYAHEKLGAPAGFFATLVDVVVATMGDAFPELRRDPAAVKAVLLEEETQFRKTLERGLLQFKRCTAGMTRGNVLPGPDAWRLYDTFGFPVDLTRLMAEELGLRVDEAAFAVAQEQAREASKGTKAAGDAERVTIDVHLMAELEQRGVPATDDAPKYTSASLDARLLAIVTREGLVTGVADTGALVGLVLDRTNFYGEQGGQLPDTGTILAADGSAAFAVTDVQVYGGYVLHTGRLQYGVLAPGVPVSCAFDELRRRPMRQNHTATHLLNFALRQVLPDADQRGSLVAPDRLRFDYAARAAPTAAQLAEIETIVNGVIQRGLDVANEPVGLEHAMQITGLRAVFGEVYPDPVRVVAVGQSAASLLADPASPAWSAHSVELCGGTHVARSSDIKQFLLLSEQNIAKGIRRIVAVTGDAAVQARATEARLLEALARVEAAPSDTVVKAFTRELDDAQVGLHARAAMRLRVDAARKAVLDADKAAGAAQAKAVTDAVTAWLADSPEEPFLLREFAVGDNTKALLAGLNALVAAGRSGLLCSRDAASGRLYYQAMVCPAHQARGVSALELAQAFGDARGGRSGGREAAAMGSAPLVADDATGLEKATRDLVALKL